MTTLAGKTEADIGWGRNGRNLQETAKKAGTQKKGGNAYQPQPKFLGGKGHHALLIGPHSETRGGQLGSPQIFQSGPDTKKTLKRKASKEEDFEIGLKMAESVEKKHGVFETELSDHQHSET